MDDGVDQGFAQGAGIEQAMLFAFGRTGDAGQSAVLYFQLVEHAVCGLEQ